MAKLTKRTVDAARPKPRDYVLWDEDLPRFGLRVRATGTKSYVIQYRAHGRTRHVTLGRPGPLTPDGARKLALGVLAEVAAGGDPAEDRDTSRETLTLRQLAFRYLAEHAEPRKKPRSAAEDRRMLERDILPVLGSRRVLQITRAEVERLQLSMRDRPTMGNRVVSLLSSLFHFAERRDLVPAFFNPSRGVQRFPERRRERFLSAQDLARLGDALKALEDAYEAGRDPRRFSSELPAAVVALRLLVFTGARTSEILGLRWERVDFEWGMLRIPDSKTGSKTIPLNAPALELLVARHAARGDSPWVNPGRPPRRAPGQPGQDLAPGPQARRHRGRPPPRPAAQLRERGRCGRTQPALDRRPPGPPAGLHDRPLRPPGRRPDPQRQRAGGLAHRGGPRRSRGGSAPGDGRAQQGARRPVWLQRRSQGRPIHLSWRLGSAPQEPGNEPLLALPCQCGSRLPPGTHLAMALGVAQLLTERDASKILCLSVRTLQKWRLCGRGPRFLKLGHAVR